MTSYERGRKAVEKALSGSYHKQRTATEYYKFCEGAFNTTQDERDYDRGVYDRLAELGYKDPSSF